MQWKRQGESPDTKRQAQSDPGVMQRTHRGHGVTDQRVKAWSENRAHVDTTDVSGDGDCVDGSKVHADGIQWMPLNAVQR